MERDQNMRPDERAALQLRRLYEGRGFRQVRPGKFEEHALYIDNKNFLQSEQIITFMDMDGKLLALKPDVTLSVVKHIPAKPLPTFQKLYYVDEVYRVSPENREYNAHSQIGVELIGPADVFAGIEVVDLALLSLEAIGERYILDLSHLGFVTGLMGNLGLSHTESRRMLSAIHAKSLHEVEDLLERHGVPDAARDSVRTLAELHGDITQVLPRARALAVGEEMEAACSELETVAGALCYNGFGGRINLDFSVVNDLDYYNGLIFRGYVEGVPQSILTGGRYDNLMRKMGKASGAAGFAISLDELNTYLRTGRRHDFDMLITYGGDSDWPALLRRVKELNTAGTSVRLEREDAALDAADFTWKQHCRFTGGTLVEIEGGNA